MKARRKGVTGKVVFITGGGSGIGLETATKLADKGALIAIVDRDTEAAKAAAAALGPRHMGLYADISDLGSLEHAVAQVREALGGIDIVVANAGIGSASTVRASTVPQLLRIIDINLSGQIRTIKATLESVIERQGYVVFTCSAAVLKNTPKSSAYAAAKAGVEAFAGALRLEIAHQGVEVGLMYPAWVPTPLIVGDGKRAGEGTNMPWPFNIVTDLEACGRRYAKAISNRERTAYLPRIHRYVHLVRPLYTGKIWDRRMFPTAARDVTIWEKDLPKGTASVSREESGPNSEPVMNTKASPQ